VNVVRNPGDYANPASTTTDPQPRLRGAATGRPAAEGSHHAENEEAEDHGAGHRRLAIPESERPTADLLTSRSAAFTFADCGVIPSCLDCGKISEQRHLRPQGLLA
jgi:hypothetical protein